MAKIKNMAQQPITRNAALRRLDALVGDWEMQASIGGQPLGHGRASFEWLEGGAFLVRHEDAKPVESLPAEMAAASPFPISAIIGLDEATEEFTMLYSDARGVSRVVQMSLSTGVWKMWRERPGFFQRFMGTFSHDGNTITGYWEKSGDGSNWEHDFDLTYTKVSACKHLRKSASKSKKAKVESK